MCRSDVKLKISPSIANEIALRIGAVESEEKQRIFHHFHRLEECGELRILAR